MYWVFPGRLLRVSVMYTGHVKTGFVMCGGRSCIFNLCTPTLNGKVRVRRKINWTRPCTFSLKMLCQYLYTLIIGQKSCNMLSTLNKLSFYKKLQNSVTNNVFGQKKHKQNKKSNIKTLAGAGNWTSDLWRPERVRYICTTRPKYRL